MSEMVLHSALVNSDEIQVGAVISIDAKTVSAGNKLALIFPNNNRAAATVISASSSELELESDTETWRLRPHAPSDGQPHANMAELDASYWTVQTKL